MHKENDGGVSHLETQDWLNLGDMILGETTHKVNYLEEEYRVLQADPRYLNDEEKGRLTDTRNKLGDQLSLWLQREQSFSEMTYKNSNELHKILHQNEIDSICENNLELYYQLKSLTEVIVRYDIELLSDRIAKQEYFHQNMLDIEKLISFAQKHQLIYLKREIEIIQNYVKNTYYRK